MVQRLTAMKVAFLLMVKFSLLKQKNDKKKMYAQTYKEAKNVIPRVQRVYHLAVVMVWWEVYFKVLHV